MSEMHRRLNQAMKARGLELKKRWVQIAREAGISTAALGAIRRGEYKPSPHTAQGLETALQWTSGSIDAIYAGGAPTPVEQSQSGTPGDEEPKDEWTLEEARAAIAELQAKMDELLAREERRRDAAG